MASDGLEAMYDIRVSLGRLKGGRPWWGVKQRLFKFPGSADRMVLEIRECLNYLIKR